MVQPALSPYNEPNLDGPDRRFFLILDSRVRTSERQSCHPQHVEAPGPADHLL